MRVIGGTASNEPGLRPQAEEADDLLTLRVPSLGKFSSSSGDFISLFQKLIDGLPEQIALLDADWRILAINGAWAKTAELYGYSALRPGTSYFEFLKEMAAIGHSAAQRVVDGMLQMADPGQEAFSLSYHGRGKWEGHSFYLRLNRIEIDGRSFITVTRYDVTELIQLRRMREGFSLSMMEGQAEERRKIAREIHDSTAQLLVGIGLTLAQLKGSRRTNRTMEIILEMEQLLAEAQREIRSISFLTHPPQLDELGLAGALRKLVDGYARRAALTIALDLAFDHQIAWPCAEAAIYRLVQEALSNIHRHSAATQVHVGLYVRRDVAHAVIVDNGVGMARDVIYGVGIPSMRSRFRELGGRLAIRSARPGTKLIASVPCGSSLLSTDELPLHRASA